MGILMYTATYLYVISMNISLVLCGYTTYYVTNDSVCGSGAVLETADSNEMNNAAIVELTQGYNSECEFRIKTSNGRYMGISAVIQKLNLRKNNVTGECIDYIQFRQSTETLKWGEKHCGNINALEDVQSKQSQRSSFDFQDNFSNMLPYIFVSRDKEIGVKVHISLETGATGLDLKIAFTSYLEYPRGSIEFMMCEDRMWISKSYINDGIVNCPFESMNDETDCRFRLGGYILCKNFFTRSAEWNNLYLPNDEYSAAIIELEDTRAVIENTPLNSGFTITTSHRMGIFAGISRMYLRQNITSGECIDYVRFRRPFEWHLNVSGESNEPLPGGKKHCGLDFKVEDECPLYSERSDLLSHSFINPLGSIDVEVFISNKSSALDRTPRVEIVFTSYTNNPIDRKMFKQCDDQTWILSSYFSDEVLNCPFATCVDIAPCRRGDNDYIDCRVDCKNGVRGRYIDLQNQRNAHLAVSLFLHFDAAAANNRPLKCEFTFNASPGMGAFAVIQKMKLRSSDVPSECVDYIRFRNSAKSRLNGSDVGLQPQPWSNKHCSLSFNPDDGCNIYSITSTLLPHAFMNPEGMIDVEVFISNDTTKLLPRASIVFTSYTGNPIDWKKFKQCSDQTWIWNSYFEDAVLNCPFVSCADFTPCTPYDDGYLKCNDLCASNKVPKTIYFNENANSAAIVELNHLNLIGKRPSHCEFEIKASSGTGVFAVIQTMELRKNNATGECVDYVEFRHFSDKYKPAEKHCGVINVPQNNCTFSETKNPLNSRMLPYAFMYPNGKVSVKIFISDENVSPEIALHSRVVFTAYIPTDKGFNSFGYEKCNAKTQIKKFYFDDGKVNCPFVSCTDEAVCRSDDDGYPKCENICSSNLRRKNINLYEYETLAAIVQLHYPSSSTSMIQRDCEFSVKTLPGMGVFAVIQKLNLRRNETTGECIDYVQFRHSGVLHLVGSNALDSLPWSDLHCGDINGSMITPLSSDLMNFSNVLSPTFINPKGGINVKMHIADQSISTEEVLYLKISFTAYKECPPNVTDYTMCSKEKCIWSTYYNVKVLNCPFVW